MFKNIEPADNKAMLNASEETLSLLSALTGNKISRGEAPLVGKYMVVNGKRIIENEPSHPDLEFAYERSEEGEIKRIYIGSSFHGPLLSWCEDGWRNLYGRGNHGKNGACGGNWSSSSRDVFETIAEVIANRNYKVTGIEMHRSLLIEGPALIEALLSLDGK